ncbi:hypothetical protein [Xanthobacter versatilis]|uniref:hypothetical protein n=1 Tax=Xanthobacter autotrophicus (strain ATCC BAA-1158 / Py2) TaxID=78245 RepID=UPI003727F768
MVQIVEDRAIEIWGYSGTGSAKFSSFARPGLVELCSSRLSKILLTEIGENSIVRTRAQYVDALIEITDFMEAAGFSEAVGAELRELALALDELGDGVVRSFLKPGRLDGRANDPGDIWSARAVVAAAVDHLGREGISRRSACQFISDRYATLISRLSPTPGNNNPFVVENWHRMLTVRKRPGSVEQMMFDRRQDLFARYAPLAGTDLVDALMRDIVVEAPAIPAQAIEKKSIKLARPLRKKPYS